MTIMLRALALRPSWPYVSEVARSLLGVLIAVAAALEWGSPAAAVGAGGSAVIVSRRDDGDGVGLHGNRTPGAR